MGLFPVKGHAVAPRRARGLPASNYFNKYAVHTEVPRAVTIVRLPEVKGFQDALVKSTQTLCQPEAKHSLN